MSGNSTSLYSTSSSNITLSSNNLTTLYPGSSGTVTPQQPYGNANVVSLLAVGTDGANTVGNISATGNITADYFIGTFQGNITGNISVPGANTDVLFNNQGNVGATNGLTFDYTSNALAVAGNVTAGGNITGSYILGNGSQLTGLPATYSNANVTSLLASFGSNTVSTTGNISGGYFLGNGSQLTGLPATYSNANVTSLLASFGSNSISTTGNITGGLFTGNGAGLTTINASNVSGTVANATYATTAGTATTANTVSDATQANITAVGTLTSLSVSGNTTAGNLLTGGQVSAAGNITGSYILGNGSQLTGLPATYSNANVVSLMAAFGSNTISTTGNVTTGNLNVQVDAVIAGNLTVNGTTTTVHSNTVTIDDKFINVANNAATASQANGGGLGVGPIGSEYATLTYNSFTNEWNTNLGVSANGNVTGNYIIGNGSLLTNINAGNIIGGYGNANVANFLANYGSNTVSTTGNITAGNVIGAVWTNAITGVASNGNIDIAPDGTGHVNIDADTLRVGDNNQPALIASRGTGNLTLQAHEGNAVQSNIRIVEGVNGNVEVNLTGTGNLNTARISASGNITAGNFFGNGSGLASLTGANVTGTVANATYALTSGTAGTANLAQYVTANAQANITSVGTLTSLSVSGNTTSGNLLTAGVVSAAGNITGSYILGNGSQLTDLPVQPGTYSNANVSAFLPVYNGNIQTKTIFSNTGVSDGVAIQSPGFVQLQYTPTGTYPANPSTIGTGHWFYLASGGATYESNATGSIKQVEMGTAGQLTADGNIQGLNLRTAGVVSASGNITGNYFIGNGSQLTGLPATYSNANVVSLLAAFGSNTISTTGNITAGYFVGNGSLLTSLTGANVTGTVANATYAVSAGTATSATTAGTVTTAAQPNITSVGTLTSVTSSGNISTTGNVSGAYFLGNGSQLTGITSSYGNANVSNFLANGFGSNTILTTGNITGGNLLTGGASGNITGVNYVNANYFVGNGALLTGIANLTQIVNGTSNVSIPTTNGSANVVVAGTLRGSFTNNGLAVTGAVSSTGNIDGGNIIAASDLTANGNIAGTNLNLSGGITATGSALNIGTITATGNIRTTGGYFVGDGGFLSNVAAGASIQNGTSNVVAYANANVTTSVGGTANVITVATTGQFVSGVVSATGNITGAAHLGGIVSATGNITTGQSTIIGTANTTGGVGNIILSGKNIATDMIRNPDSGNTTFVDPSRILIGTGYNGNTNPGILYNTASAARLWVSDAFNRGNNAQGSRTIVATDFITLTANVTNTGWRVGALTFQPVIGGGSAGNTVNAGPFGIVGVLGTPQIGGGLTGNLTALGNTTTQYAAGAFLGTQVSQGSNIGNSLGIVSFTSHQGGGGVSSFGNSIIGFTDYSLSNVTPTTYAVYHHASNVASSYGVSVTNAVRAASNYYFLKNDDAVAQAQIGSLRSYSEFNYTNTATSGAVTIDKNNAQVQQVNLTGNVTSLTYSNFVSSASDSVNTDEQADTVTIIFNQGATGGYGVTFPSGSAYKYAGGTNTLSATTANSVSLVAITAIRISGTTTYLTTISPAFT